MGQKSQVLTLFHICRTDMDHDQATTSAQPTQKLFPVRCQRNRQDNLSRAAELDLIIERPGKPAALVEIKSSTMVDDNDLRHLKRFQKAMPDSVALCLSRESSMRIVGGIRVLPWRQGLDELGLSVRPGTS